ncbi:hypothetical protein [Erwinia amylovora]|uniref:hypothetical protein n=1 Tax=Erwinia amylovora TaxID=552 RepID=UPI000C0711A9|nr:hypothetical protein [Erwinia amylovora]UDJ88604.1 hypothetical protein IRM68_18055 [Erwinia amylovora]
MTKKYKFRDLSKPAPATVYISSERYAILEKYATKLSDAKNMKVKVSDILKFLIDEYTAKAMKELEVIMDDVKISS